MTSMLLIKSIDEAEEDPSAHWTLDCPTRGVVIVDVGVGSNASAAPLHWRAGDWTKPPLDLRLSEQGLIESIQFVFQDESVEVQEIPLPSASEFGLPTFDVSDWPDDRYLDARVVVKTMRLVSGELYAAIGNAEVDRAVSAAHGLRLEFDSAGQLVGIAVGPLSDDEWQLVDAAAP